MNNTRTNEDDIMIPSAHGQVLNLIMFLVRLRLPSLFLYVTSRLALDIRVSLGPLASHPVSHPDALNSKQKHNEGSHCFRHGVADTAKDARRG